MRYATVEDKIRRVVDGMGMGTDVAYLFMNWAQANVAMDDIDRPTIVYVLPPSGTLTVGWARIKDAPLTQMAFLAPSDFDFNGHRNDNIVEYTKRLCCRFLKAYNESGLFEVIEGAVKYQVVYDHLDHNVTGIVISLDIEEVDGVAICDIIGRDGDEGTDGTEE